MPVDPLEQELDVQDHQVVKCDNGSKPRAFLQVEKMLEEKLPNSGLRASPHIELRVKTLKKQFNDNAKKMVLCDQDVFEGHKDANGLRLKPFPHFDDLSLVLVKILDQVEASNGIGVDDLEVEVNASHTNTLHPLQVEWNVHHNLVGKEQGMMTQL
ncbi:hypothetical protein AAG906_005335 [Vitis piasezkii]